MRRHILPQARGTPRRRRLHAIAALSKGTPFESAAYVKYFLPLFNVIKYFTLRRSQLNLKK
jgi:hypothetical protein